MTREEKTFRLTLRSNPRQIRRVEGLLNKVHHYLHLDEIQMHKLMVSVTEAANNAIIHGNKMDGEKRVTVVCTVRTPWLIFTIADQGRGFDPRKVASPLKKKNLLKSSGRGIFLMKTLMDKVDYQVTADGVRVELWLDLKKE